ncbi:NAD(P)-dependent oxidoreductase [Levilactobacillus namurensis]|nr:NAD(P)H-binding protein [Levilactobacillus namurensis]GEO74940.1 NAD(P)-dependent oxidoreductase [Levilactobacillus namurensis]
MKILVTGATGGYGQRALKSLRQFASVGTELYGLVRNTNHNQELQEQGVTPRIGDYRDPASLQQAFRDIDRILFVSVPDQNLQRNVVQALQRSTIKFVAYTSLFGLEYPKFGLEQNHRETERLLRATGISHTFLRNGFYLEMVAPQLKAAIQTGYLSDASAGGRVAWVLKQDLAEAGARVVLADHTPEIVNLAGRPVTYQELGQVAAKVAQKTIQVHEVSGTQLLDNLAMAHLTPMEQQLTAAYQSYAQVGHNGEDVADSRTLEQILGRPVTDLAVAVEQILNDPKML